MDKPSTLLSMTGFGTAEGVFSLRRGKIAISVEIKTVNSKFLDISIRSPRPFSIFDNDVAAFIRKRLRRGRVDVNLNARTLEGTDREWQVNRTQARAIKDALCSVQSELHLKGDVALSDLLVFPEWLQSAEVPLNKEEEWPALESVLSEALTKVTEARRAEGRALHQIILDQRNRFSEFFQKFSANQDRFLPLLRERMKERVQSIHGANGLDPQRLEQEIVLWVARSDVKEEIDRTRHHLDTFDGLLKNESEVGRKLEFILQELQREVNTMGTKCPDASLTPAIVELKTCIERMKEQIQNVE